jgi:hypothetical protein
VPALRRAEAAEPRNQAAQVLLTAVLPRGDEASQPTAEASAGSLPVLRLFAAPSRQSRGAVSRDLRRLPPPSVAGATDSLRLSRMREELSLAWPWQVVLLCRVPGEDEAGRLPMLRAAFHKEDPKADLLFGQVLVQAR